MKRLLCMMLAAGVVITLSGCLTSDYDRSGMDYNQYMGSSGLYALCESDITIIKNDNRLYELDKKTSVAHIICTKPECNHNTSDCPAFMEESIFASGDQIYYIDQDNSFDYGLYRMDTDGQNRERIKKLDLINSLSSKSIGYSCGVYGEYLLVDLTVVTPDRNCSAIYKTTIADDDSQLDPVFGSVEDDSVIYIEARRRGDWIFAIGKDKEDRCGLYGYNLTKGTAELLIEDWDCHAPYPVISHSNELCWFFPGDGFYKMPLDTMEIMKLRSAEDNTEDGYAGYDDRYLYLSNNVKQIGAEINIPEEDQGVRIYDYAGKLVYFLAASGLMGKPAYAFSTADRIYFSNADIKSGMPDMMPLWWIDKNKIEDGTAVWMPVIVY